MCAVCAHEVKLLIEYLDKVYGSCYLCAQRLDAVRLARQSHVRGDCRSMPLPRCYSLHGYRELTIHGGFQPP